MSEGAWGALVRYCSVYILSLKRWLHCLHSIVMGFPGEVDKQSRKMNRKVKAKLRTAPSIDRRTKEIGPYWVNVASGLIKKQIQYWPLLLVKPTEA